MFFFNIAIAVVATCSAYSLSIANKVWKPIINVFWSPQMLSIIAFIIGAISFYLLYRAGEEVSNKITTKFERLNNELKTRDNQIACLYGLLIEIENLNLDAKPIKELSAFAIINRDTQMMRLQSIIEKIKAVRTLRIDVDLAKKVN